MLNQRFRGVTVSIREIEEYVIGGTPFRNSGYKAEVLKPMEEAVPAQIKVVSCEPKRKRGTFGDPEMLIQFL